MGLSLKKIAGAFAGGGMLGGQGLIAGQKLKGLLGPGGDVQASLELEKERDRLASEGKTLDALLRDKLTGTNAQEAKLKGELTQNTGAAQELLGKQLQNQLGDIAVQEGQASSQVGEVQSESGLLRSTFTADKLKDVTLAGLEARGEAKFKAGEMSQQIADTEKNVLRDIEFKREQIDFEFKSLEREQIQGLLQNVNEDLIRQKYSAELQNAKMNAASKQAFLGAIGGLAGSAGKILGGA